MNFTKAVRAAQKGNKIRRKAWKNDAYSWVEKKSSDKAEQFFVHGTFFDVNDIFADDWEIVSKSQTMGFMQAVEMMVQGKKVRRLCWEGNTFMQVSCDSIKATDWIVVENESSTMPLPAKRSQNVS